MNLKSHLVLWRAEHVGCTIEDCVIVFIGAQQVLVFVGM
jgi:hypothetical protein